MRTHKTLAALVMSAVLLPAAALAHGHGPDADRLAARLGLSPEQKTQVEQIFKDQRAKREALRAETRAKLAKVLTAEQMERLERRRHCHDGWERWRHSHDGSSAPTPGATPPAPAGSAPPAQ